MKQQGIVICNDCKSKADKNDTEDYALCEICDPQIILCTECWISHDCNLADRELEEIRGELQFECWKEDQLG